jgi:hypothetical protein
VIQLKQYDKDRDGQLSVQEFPKNILVARRVGLDSTVEGADNNRPSLSIFRTADVNKNGKISRQEWTDYSNSLAVEAPEHGLLAIKPGGSGDVSSTHHPAWAIERDSPCAMLRCWKLLGYDQPPTTGLGNLSSTLHRSIRPEVSQSMTYAGLTHSITKNQGARR